ncbi:DUF3536 domain-containing protein [Candidatus Kuenenia sp.]|uniref:DUF3536 domain-containing protein n=1 Tax=Candidatus Kuenenia sp. TaxID=2499824 RepID=UPI0032202F13
MERYICIHGHFYQPPRENPWLEDVELQDSAYPYHDWNERITAECYAPNATSRILDVDGRIVDIVNIYSKISFNFGHTLLSWMEKHKPDVYQAILDADKLSREHFSGHGSALAQIYNHLIMPLANKRDKYTQVIWGLRDFQSRFGRDAEGMWLPETAVNTETLEVLAELGIKFTVLAPRQALKMKKMTDQNWIVMENGEIDPTTPYICKLPSGRSICIFFYDGPISQDIAFGSLLKNGENFATRLLSAFTENRDWPQLVHIATDGETYGHHHFKGDMALAYCLYYIESKNLAKITNYGEYLEKHPPMFEAKIKENTSWSCIHGVERWKDNCGCCSGRHPGWTQEWRAPLRTAMDKLRDKLAAIYETEAGKYLKNPWSARDAYIEVIRDRSEATVRRFLENQAIETPAKEEIIKILKLLEMQRNAMLMYTSCGWFFDEISGIETVQITQYAARAIHLAEEFSDSAVEPEYRALLKGIKSNVPKYENGDKIYELFVKPCKINLLNVCAHYAISSLFEDLQEDTPIYCYSVKTEQYERLHAGKLKLALGKTQVVSGITWEEAVIVFAVIHLGDHNVSGGVKDFTTDEEFSNIFKEIRSIFDRGEIPDVIRRMDHYFGDYSYSLGHLFKDRKRMILDQILQSTMKEIEVSFKMIYENNYSLLNFFHYLQAPPPRPLFLTAEYTVNRDLINIFSAEEEMSLEKLENLINETKRWPFTIDKDAIGFAANVWINSRMERLRKKPSDISLVEEIDAVIKLLNSLSIKLDMWEAQNIYFHIGKNIYHTMKEKSLTEDPRFKRWEEAFKKLGYYLGVKVS